jgi:hypothetical protein
VGGGGEGGCGRGCRRWRGGALRLPLAVGVVGVDPLAVESGEGGVGGGRRGGR